MPNNLLIATAVKLLIVVETETKNVEMEVSSKFRLRALS